MSESSASETLGQLPRTYRFGQRTGLNYTTESAVDADLSGIGVTISFMATAFATFLLLLWGLHRNIILDDPGLQHPLDKAVFKCLGSKSPPTGPQRLREKRALRAAMLTLGDQQILVGIGLLIAGIQNATLSFYSCRNLVAISWLSGTTLLFTLIVTNQGTTKGLNMVMKRIRAVGMTLFLVLILYAYILQLWAAYQLDYLYVDIWSLKAREQQTHGDYILEVSKYAVYYFFGESYTGIKGSFLNGPFLNSTSSEVAINDYTITIIVCLGYDTFVGLIIIGVFLHHFLAFYFGAQFPGARLLIRSWIFQWLAVSFLGARSHFPTGFQYAEFQRTVSQKRWQEFISNIRCQWLKFSFAAISINGSEEKMKEPDDIQREDCYYLLFSLLKSKMKSRTSHELGASQQLFESQHRIDSNSGFRSGPVTTTTTSSDNNPTNQISPAGIRPTSPPPTTIDAADFKILTSKHNWLIRCFHKLELFLTAPRSSDRRASLVNETLAVYFVFVQSLTRFVICWSVYGKIKDDEVRKDIQNWGLGQIVAILLLPGPILAWLQEYYDYIPSTIITTPQTTTTSTVTSSRRGSGIHQMNTTGTEELDNMQANSSSCNSYQWGEKIIEESVVPYLEGRIEDSALEERNIAIDLGEDIVTISYTPLTDQQPWNGRYRLLSVDEALSAYYQSREFSRQSTLSTGVQLFLLTATIVLQLDWELETLGGISILFVVINTTAGLFIVVGYFLCILWYEVLSLRRDIGILKKCRKERAFSAALFQVASSIGCPTGGELEAGGTETLEAEQLRKIGAHLAMERRTEAKLRVRVSAAEEDEHIRKQFAIQKIKELEESESSACRRVEEALIAANIFRRQRGGPTIPTGDDLGIGPLQLGRHTDATTAPPEIETTNDTTNPVDDQTANDSLANGGVETCDGIEMDEIVGNKKDVEHVPVASEELGSRSESCEDAVIEEDSTMRVLHRN